MWRQPENQSSWWDLLPIWGSRRTQADVSTFGIRLKKSEEPNFEFDNRGRDPSTIHSSFPLNHCIVVLESEDLSKCSDFPPRVPIFVMVALGDEYPKFRILNW